MELPHGGTTKYLTISLSASGKCEGTRVSLGTGSADGPDSEQLSKMSSTPRSDEDANMSVKTSLDGDARQKPVQLREELSHDKLNTVPTGASRRNVVDKDVMGLQAPKVDADADAKGDKVGRLVAESQSLNQVSGTQ